jgi:hypothetical protein
MAQFFEGSPAVLSDQAPALVLRQGVATVPAGAQVTAAILDSRVSATSVIVCWGVGVADATATAFSVDVIVANASFRIGSDANATADKVVGWAVLKY